MEPNERPHRCSTCDQSFARANHLKRHARLHVGSYRCVCEQTFSRNDALSRHLRRCVVAQRDTETVQRFQSIGPKKQIRDKRACDNCANLKLKCTFQHPCDQCHRKSLTCKYTRNGYVDPYEAFRVEKDRSYLGSDAICGRSRRVPTVDMQLNAFPPTVHEAYSRGSEDVQEKNALYNQSRQSVAPPTSTGIADTSSLEYSEMETSFMISDQDSNDWLPMDFSTADFDIATQLSLPFDSAFDPNVHSLYVDLIQQLDPPVPENRTYVTGEERDLDLASKLSPSPIDGFTLRQLDPVEAKCAEIRDILHGAESLIHPEDISNYITRDNVLMCGQLFGRHLSRNIPIVHSPTFMLTEAPPLLLLAVTLGGACYCNNAMPAKFIIRFAMGLLLLIERQPHEIEMKVPEISTVQASIIACCILLGSRHDGARRFASVHFARSISMADRLGIFREDGTVDYASLTVETFNWLSWIDQESRRRVSCEIFCLDMAFCIFLGKSPYFSAFSFLTRMPCHEIAWEANAPAACLRYLRDLAPKMDVATGMRELRSFGDEEQRILEISDFGMFTLILALHSSLFRIIQEEPKPHTSPRLIRTIFQGMDPVPMMHQQLTDEKVRALADRAVELCGSLAMKQYNEILRAWKQVWDQLRGRDQGPKARTFSADPLPFWYLAKLYQVLYLFSDLVEGEMDIDIPVRRGGHDPWRPELHDKIVSWLSDFRDQASFKGLEGQRTELEVTREAAWEASVLCKLMKPT